MAPFSYDPSAAGGRRRDDSRHEERVTKVTVLAAAFAACLCACSARPEHERDLVLAARRTLSPYEGTPATRKLLRKTTDAAWTLDAASLYSALPESGAGDGARAVVFEAEENGGHRMIRQKAASLAEIDVGPGGPALHEAGAEPGGGWLFVGARPLFGGEAHRLRVTSAIDTGAGDSLIAWREVPDVLRALETAPDGAVLFSLGGLDREWPRATAFLASYFDTRVVSRPAAVGHDVEIVSEPRFEKLRADYPRFERWLAHMLRSFRTSGAISTESGGELIRWTFRNPVPDERLRVSFAALDGRVVSRSPEATVDLTLPFRLRVVYTAAIETYGLTTTMRGIGATVSGDLTAARPTIATEVRGEPEAVSVEGAFLGIVPLGIVDMLIPGSVESATRAVLSGLLTGRDGRGVLVETEWRADGPDRHAVGSTLATDVPSGRLVRIALRIAAALMRTSEAERAELVRFLRDLADRAMADAAVRTAQWPSRISAEIVNQSSPTPIDSPWLMNHPASLGNPMPGSAARVAWSRWMSTITNP